MVRMLETLYEPTLFFQSVVNMKLVSENRWHIIAGHSRKIILSTEYRNMRENLTAQFRQARATILSTHKPNDRWHPNTVEILKEGSDTYCVAVLALWLWKMKDTGNYLKPIADSVQDAGIVKNDRKIIDVVQNRHFHPKSTGDLLIVSLYEIPQRFHEKIRKEQEGRFSELLQE